MVLDNRARVVYIDALKGFAILLVIVGHLIQWNFESGINNRLFDLIYSFHMPLFFFLSGYSRSIEEDKKGIINNGKLLYRYLLKKFFTLIVPSISWTLLVPSFFNDVFIFNVNISKFWFLNVLFLCFLIRELYVYFFKHKWYLFFFLLILFVLGVKQILALYFLMFIWGDYFQKNNCIKWNKYVFSISALIFLFSIGYYDYGKESWGDPNRGWLMLPISITGILAFMRISYFLSDKMFFLDKLGQYTLGIYLIHFYFVQLDFVAVFENYGLLVQFLLLMCVGIVISLACVMIQKLIEPFYLLNGILFGKWNRTLD